jgi:signal transduction histidine kinase
MESLSIVLVDTTDAFKDLLERSSQNNGLSRFVVRRIGPKAEKDTFEGFSEPLDVVILGEKISPSITVQFARSFRSAGVTAPIFALTRVSEATVPRAFQRAGVDDMLNVAEVSSPLFSWTFTSMVRQAQDRKKAVEFDMMTNKLKGANQSLSFITHEITSPLSVIRLVIYHLEAPGLTNDKKETLLKMLASNIDRVDAQIEELRAVRRQLANGEPAKGAVPSQKMVKQKFQAA